MSPMFRALTLAAAAASLAACEHALSEPGDYEAGAGVSEADAAEIPGSPHDLLLTEDPGPLSDPIPVAERLVEPEEGLLD